MIFPGKYTDLLYLRPYIQEFSLQDEASVHYSSRVLLHLLIISCTPCLLMPRSSATSLSENPPAPRSHKPAAVSLSEVLHKNHINNLALQTSPSVITLTILTSFPMCCQAFSLDELNFILFCLVLSCVKSTLL